MVLRKFRRIEVISGDVLAGDLQEIKSGLKAGEQVEITELSGE